MWDVTQPAATTHTDTKSLLHLGRWVPVALPYAVPFAFCGLILGLLLSDPRLPTRRIYFADLLGSAVGAFAVIPAISGMGVERSVLAACAVMLAAAFVLARPAGRVPWVLGALAAVAVLGAAAAESWVFDMRYPSQSPLWNIQRLPGHAIEYIAWDPVTRVEVSKIPPPKPEAIHTPSLIGSNRDFHRRFRRMLTQNNWAFTYAVDYDGRRESLRGIEETIYAAPYYAVGASRPKALVIGVGGGFDVLTALYFDAQEVTGVEVNAAIVDILTRVYRDYFRSWVSDPRVHLVAAEGRHYLSTRGAEYDVIQLSGVDSYSGTPGAAHVFSESYLYTSEAFDLYLSRLAPDGILSMMRVEFTLPRDMLRVLIMAAGALRRAGVEQPADHIVVVAEPTLHYVDVLVKRSPFTAAELQRVSAWVAENPYLTLVAGPRLNDPEGSMYERFLALADPAKEEAFVRSYPLDVSPLPDDRPFFFRNSGWRHLFATDATLREYVVPVMEYTIVALLVAIGIAAVVCVLVPLHLLAARGYRVRNAPRYAAFFGAIGLGYMAVEVALLQKLGLFLGHPNYALSVVLAVLLFTTGLGSLLSGWLVGRAGGLRGMGAIVAGIVLVEVYVVLPRLTGLIDLPFALRVAIVGVLVAPFGLSLGTFFPTGLEQLKHSASAFAPWAWGVNGIASVLAPVLGVAVSMTWGTTSLLLLGAPIYLLAGLVLPRSAAPAERRDAAAT